MDQLPVESVSAFLARVPLLAEDELALLRRRHDDRVRREWRQLLDERAEASDLIERSR